MIRSQQQLRGALAQGLTVARMTEYSGGGLCWAIAQTGESVDSRALRSLITKAEIIPIATDICGEPSQWGPAQ